jgi:ATP-dependent helicase HrpB
VLPAAGTPGTDLPVRAVLTELEAALRQAGAAVLVAPPGTGKTSLVPLLLAGLVEGRVVVAEPRRIAARAAARRMAALVGEPLGGRVGHTVRGESTVGPRTRIEVVTTGVLVRRFQRDAELQGTDAVVLDECHERHLDTDLALAFGVDVRAALRPDLLLLAMSATAQSAAVAAALGGAPVVEATGGLFDVTTVWAPPNRPVTPAFGLRVDPALLDHVAGVVRRAFAEQQGDLLVFLPGTGEINLLAGRLRDLPVVPLHGRLPAAAQDAALRAGNGRRVVLATSVAESSLTVPGVRVVVDAGLARVPRVDLGRGLGTLATVPVSRASAHQRAGRSGREGPGVVYRCWSAAEHDRLPAFPEPEISSADLTAFVLELAAWGAPEGRGLALLDPLPPGALTVATETLLGLEAIHADGTVTARGRELTAAGVHPRLARALLDGAGLVGARRAAEVVAVLSDDGLAGGTDDLAVALRALRDGRDRAATERWKAEVSRLVRTSQTSDVPGDLAMGLVVGLAFPERVARLRQPGGRTYLMASGTAAELPAGSPLTGAGWLAIAVADRAAGSRDARIRLAAALDEDAALEAGATLLRTVDEVVWEDGDVRARRREQLGAIVLRTRPLPDPDPAARALALQEGLRQEGLALLRWTDAARDLRERLQACREGVGEPWPDVSDEALLAMLDLSAARSRVDLQRIDLSRQLRALIPWSVAGLLEQVAPERLTVPSGSAVKVDYTDPTAPTLAVKVQEVFGWTPPAVAGRPLRLHLLSPGRRVVAVTSDLLSFWGQGYPGVRAELRGRYPRHDWPEDPTRAAPSSRPKPRG